jgi:hypothetical protein
VAPLPSRRPLCTVDVVVEGFVVAVVCAAVCVVDADFDDAIVAVDAAAAADVIFARDADTSTTTPQQIRANNIVTAPTGDNANARPRRRCLSPIHARTYVRGRDGAADAVIGAYEIKTLHRLMSCCEKGVDQISHQIQTSSCS